MKQLKRLNFLSIFLSILCLIALNKLSILTIILFCLFVIIIFISKSLFLNLFVLYILLTFYIKSYLITKFLENFEYGLLIFNKPSEQISFGLDIANNILIPSFFLLIVFTIIFKRGKVSIFNNDFFISVPILNLVVIISFQISRHYFKYSIAGVGSNFEGIGPVWMFFETLSTYSLLSLFFLFLNNKDYRYVFYSSCLVYGVSELLAGWKGPLIIFSTFFLYFFYYVKNASFNYFKSILLLTPVIIFSYTFGRFFRQQNLDPNLASQGVEFGINPILNISLDFYNRFLGLESLMSFYDFFGAQKFHFEEVSLRNAPRFYTRNVLGYPDWAIHSSSPGFFVENIIVFKEFWSIYSVTIIVLIISIYSFVRIKNQFLDLVFSFTGIFSFYYISQGGGYAYISRYLFLLVFSIFFYFFYDFQYKKS